MNNNHKRHVSVTQRAAVNQENDGQQLFANKTISAARLNGPKQVFGDVKNIFYENKSIEKGITSHNSPLFKKSIKNDIPNNFEKKKIEFNDNSIDDLLDSFPIKIPKENFDPFYETFKFSNDDINKIIFSDVKDPEAPFFPDIHVEEIEDLPSYDSDLSFDIPKFDDWESGNGSINFLLDSSKEDELGFVEDDLPEFYSCF